MDGKAHIRQLAWSIGRINECVCCLYQVFVGDGITPAAIQGILPLLHEASSHPQAFTRFFVDKVGPCAMMHFFE